MRLNGKWVGAGIAVAAAAAIGGWYWRERSTERPNFRVILTDGDFQLRAYPMLVVAGTEIVGARRSAIQRGIKVLSDYILGRSREGEAIAMTTPILSDRQSDGRWRTRFIMPGKWTRASLPEPGPEVTIDEVPARRVAAIRFSGKVDERILTAHEQVLRQWIEDKGLHIAGLPEHAYYGSASTPALLRRTEVLIPVD